MTIDPSEWIDHPLRYWREKKTFDGYYVLIYRDAIVGYIKITQLYPHRRRLQHIFSVGPLYIHPEYRSLGYAKRLLGYSLQECLQNSGLSMINVNLAVNIHNIPAQKLYRSCGFSEIGIVKNFLLIGEEYHDVIRMQKLVSEKDS